MGKLANILQPVAGYATIQPLSEKENNKSQLIIKKAEKDYFIKGKVLKIGKPLTTQTGETIKPPAKEGDTVLYSSSGNFETITQGNETLEIVKFQAIVGVYA